MSAAKRREPLQQRVYREMAEQLKARLEGQDMTIQAVIDAMHRIQARARLKVARRLQGSADGSLIADVLAALEKDSPERAAQDEALVCRWRQAQGVVVDAPGARQRIAHRLAEMAERQQANATVAPSVMVHAQPWPRLTLLVQS
jgi:ATP-dependent exoDNAse (exonuclease V) beta subunit